MQSSSASQGSEAVSVTATTSGSSDTSGTDATSSGGVASEVGVVDVPSENIASKGALQPGQFVVLDWAEKRIIYDKELKKNAITSFPYQQWLESTIFLKDLIDDDDECSRRNKERA